MVQKEIAKENNRETTPRRGKESILSISVKAYGDPKMVMKGAGSIFFHLPPKVDSAVIAIKIFPERFL